MTPRVRKMVSLLKEMASEITWFDIGQVPEFGNPLLTNAVRYTPMPFPACALCGSDADGNEFVLICKTVENSMATFGYGFSAHGERAEFPVIAFIRDASGELKLGPSLDGKPPPTRQNLNVTTGIMGHFLGSLDQPVQAYAPTPKAGSFINRKRIAKGKAPLYEWRTIDVEPPKPKSEDRGGTHASPRRHERRGHYRTTKTGKRVWVRNCVVGNAALGTVFHDYRVPEKQEAAA